VSNFSKELTHNLLKLTRQKCHGHPDCGGRQGAFLFDCFAAVSVDHAPVILGQFFAKMSRRLGQQVAQTAFLLSLSMGVIFLYSPGSECKSFGELAR
jgi:hypothetical protein